MSNLRDMQIGFEFDIDDGPFKELNKSLDSFAGVNKDLTKGINSTTKQLNSMSTASKASSKGLVVISGGLDNATKSSRDMQKSLKGTADELKSTSGAAQSTERNFRVLSGGANTLANSTNKVAQEAKKASLDWGKLGNEFQSAGTKITSAGQKMRSVGKGLTKYLTLPAVGAATALAGITIKKGFDRLIGIDSARAKLQGLGHDANNITKIMDSALTSVKGTSFAMDEAVTTAANAVAAGVKEGKELTRYLTLTGDAAAIAGVSMGEMGAVLNKVKTANVAYNGELQQLSDRGLPIYQWLAEEANVAADSVAKLASEGGVSSKMLMNAIEKNIGGAAKEMGGKSFTAAMANMWAAVGRLGANFLDAGGKGGGFFSQLKPLITDFTTSIDSMGDVAESAGKKFGSMFAGFIEKMKAVKAWYDNLSPISQGIVKKITLIGTIFMVTIGPVITALGIFGFMIGNIATGIGAIAKAIGFLAPYFAKLTAGLKVMFGFLTALSAPVWITIAAVVALGTAFVLLWKHSETFRNAILAGWSAIKTATKVTVDFIISVTSSMWNGAVAGFIKVGEIVSAGWISIKGVTKTSAAYVASVTSSMWDSTVEGATKAGNLGKAIINGFRDTFASMRNYFVETGEKIVSLISEGMNSKVGQLISGFFEQWKTSFSNVDGIISMLAPTITTIGLSLMGVAGPIGFVISGIVSLVSFLYRLSKTNEDVRNVFISVWQNIKDVFSSVASAFEPIIEVYKDTFSSMMTELKPEFAETGQVIMESFNELKPVFKELGSAFGELGKAFGTIVMEIGAAFRDILPAILPTVKELGKAWLNLQMSTFEMGITIAKTVLPILLDAAKQVLPIVVSLVKVVAETFLMLAKSVLPILLSTVKMVFNVALQIIRSVVPLVIEVISALATVVTEIAKAVLPLLLSVVKSVFSVIGQIIKAVVPIITAVIASLVPVIMEIAKIVIPLLLSVVKTVFPLIMTIIKLVIPIIANVLKVVAFVITTVLIPAIKFVLEIVKIVFPFIVNVIRNALNIVIGVIRFFTALFKGDWNGLWNSIVLILSSVWGIIKSVIQTALNLVILTVRTGWGWIKSITSSVFTGIWNFIKSIFGKVFSSISTFITKIVGGIKTGWQTAKNNTVTMMSNMKTAVTDKFSAIVDAAKALPGKIGKGIKGAAGKAMDGIKTLANKMTEGLAKGVNGVGSGINWVFKKIGVKTRIPEWEPEKFAKGTSYHMGGPAIVGDGGMHELIRTPSGAIGLSPDKDTLVNLPRGSEVLSGPKTAMLMQAGMPAYKKGAGKGALHAAAAAVKNTTTKAVQGTKNAAGAAVNKTKDVAGAAWDTTKNAAGQVKDLAIDVWDYVSEPKKLMTKVWNKIGAKFPKMPGAFGNIGSGTIKMIKDKAVGFVKNKIGDFGDAGNFKGGAAAPDQVKKWIAQALSITDTPMSWMPAMLVKAQKESGYNPRAINLWDINAKRGIPSKGLFQTIDPTFNAYKMPGMNDIYNPVHNAVAAIRYIKARYGTIFNTPGIKSMARGGGYKGYKNGTNFHPGGPAWLGDGWKHELFQTPQGVVGMSPDVPTLMDLPRGSKVLSGNKTKQRMDSAQTAETTAVRTGGGAQYNIEFKPIIQVTVEGGGDQADRTAKSIKEQVAEQMEEFFAMMNAKMLREG